MIIKKYPKSFAANKHYSVKLFYVVEGNDKCVYFLKIGINSYSLKNEVLLASALNSFGIKFINKYFKYEEEVYANRFFDLLLCEFIDRPYHQLITDENNFNKKNFYVNMLNILAIFRKFGIHHNDLSRRNIFVNEEGDIKIIDFGLSHIDGIDNGWLYYHECWGNGFEFNNDTITYNDIDTVKWIFWIHCREYINNSDLDKYKFPFTAKVKG